MQGTKKQEVKE